MTDPPLKFPDWSDHPPPPRMTFEQYQHLICHEIIPALVARGEMDPDKLIEEFRRNEGSVTSWPSFSDEMRSPSD